MFDNYAFTAADRFMRYVQVDTQSDPLSDKQPTTEKQKDLSRILVQELLSMGISDAHLDEHGYVYATIPSNTDQDVPVICFCSHVDTAPDASGTGVKPVLRPAYDGGKITFPDDAGLTLSPADFPYLDQLKGHDIITASGTTLLGADDKAGVAAIMDAAHYLVRHEEIKHGTIRILFTPDEEVGKGTAKVDIQKLGAAFGYTLDGGEQGSLEDETFSADAVQIIIRGVITHPGYAKGKLVNAMKVAGDVLSTLPRASLSPETTEGQEGFIHPVRIDGNAERCTIDFIIRDFNTPELAVKEAVLKAVADEVVTSHPGTSFDFIVTEQYRNMKEVLDEYPQVIAYAREAIARAGMKVTMESIRGGTDGSKLSFMGLPCANLFTGMQGIHSMKEFVSVQDMNKAVETIVHLVKVWEEREGADAQ